MISVDGNFLDFVFWYFIWLMMFVEEGGMEIMFVFKLLNISSVVELFMEFVLIKICVGICNVVFGFGLFGK